jgi:hypothetical protein
MWFGIVVKQIYDMLSVFTIDFWILQVANSSFDLAFYFEVIKLVFICALHESFYYLLGKKKEEGIRSLHLCSVYIYIYIYIYIDTHTHTLFFKGFK